jgi:bifunctional NMN adenylyltransferase/nudix hydrolase
MKVGVVFVRCQPFHKGEMFLLSKALEIVDELIIIVTSVQKMRTLDNPFLSEEIFSLMKKYIGKKRIRNVIGVGDLLYDEDHWLLQANRIILENISEKDEEFYIIGHKNDKNDFYGMFDFDFIDVCDFTDHGSEYKVTDDILYEYFKNSKISDEVVDKKLLQKFMQTDEYLDLKIQFKNNENLFPAIFTCVDALVICNKHFLLVKRKDNGLYALPGGFLDASELLIDSCKKNVKEKTGLTLNNSDVIGMHVFDYVNRSKIGRAISNCYFFVLDEKELPKVKGSGEFVEAEWVYFDDLQDLTFHEDHYSIIYHSIRLMEEI